MDSNKNLLILNIDNSEYYIDSLSEEAKWWVNGLRKVDLTIKMY